MILVSEYTAGCELDELGRLGVTVPHPSSPLKPSSSHTVLLHSHSLQLDRYLINPLFAPYYPSTPPFPKHPFFHLIAIHRTNLKSLSCVKMRLKHG